MTPDKATGPSFLTPALQSSHRRLHIVSAVCGTLVIGLSLYDRHWWSVALWSLFIVQSLVVERASVRNPGSTALRWSSILLIVAMLAALLEYHVGQPH